MSSNRLPGKVLMDLEGKVILEWTIERLAKNISNIPIAVITSNEESDDPINSLCRKKKVPCYRGSLNNVLERFYNACIFFQEENFIRISGDSPLIDPRIIDKAYEIFSRNKVDLISNIMKRSFPKGQSVELVSKDAIHKLRKFDLKDSELEHVTLGFYNNKDNFEIINFESEYINCAMQQQSVDTYSDYLKLSNFIKQNKNVENLSWIEIYNKIKNKY